MTTGETASSNPNVDISYFPGPQHTPIPPGFEQLYIEWAELGFAALREGGINVPEVTFSLEETTPEVARITVTTPIIEGEQFPAGWQMRTVPAETPMQDKGLESWLKSC